MRTPFPLALLAAAVCLAAAGTAPRPPAPRPALRVASPGIAFEPNQGQADPAFAWLGRGPGLAVGLAPDRAVVRGPRGEVLRLRLAGASSRAPGVAEGERPGRVHVLRGPRERWVRGLPTAERVRFHEVYPGIDLLYRGSGARLEYDFLLRPGADPAAIRLAPGVPAALTPEGDLVLSSLGGTVVQHRPAAYQEAGCCRQAVAVRYRLEGPPDSREVRLEVGDYDRSRPLVIDPLLSFSTYLGGGANDDALAVAAEPGGGFVVAGATLSADFPTADPLQGGLAGAGNRSDAWVARFTPSGELIYATYLGGSGTDTALGVALGPGGAVTLAGRTDSADFPLASPFQPARNGGDFDGFVARLAPDGGSLEFSTFLGGAGPDYVTALALDADGAAVVTGGTGSADFPVQAALQPQAAGNPALGEAFVTRFTPAGTALVWSTYLGGIRPENVQLLDGGIAVDADGAVYVTGTTYSMDFPTTEGAPDRSFGPNPAFGEAFVAKITPAGDSLAWSTYLGGSGEDSGRALAVGGGRVVAAGATASADFPVASARQPAYGGGAQDAWAAVLDAETAAPVWITYHGGSATDLAHGVDFDPAGTCTWPERPSRPTFRPPA